MKGELAKPNNIVSSGVVIQACAALGNSLWFLCLGFWYLQKVVKMLISFILFWYPGKKLTISVVIWRDRKSNTYWQF